MAITSYDQLGKARKIAIMISLVSTQLVQVMPLIPTLMLTQLTAAADDAPWRRSRNITIHWGANWGNRKNRDLDCGCVLVRLQLTPHVGLPIS